MVDKPKLDQMLSNLHLYWDVDDARVHEYLRDSLGDIERFGSAIARREW